MTELPPQDPWRGQAPLPPPPPPPYDPTMAFAPPPRPSWWSRQTTALKVLMISGVAVLACCGGLMGIGIAAGPTPEPSKSPKTAAPQEVQAVAPPVTTEASSAAPEPSPTTAAPTSAKPSPKPTPRKTTPAAVYYKNCDAVRAAGQAPLLKGEPGYRTGLDADLDGEACEPSGGNGDTGGGDSGGGGNDPRFDTCGEAKDNGYGPYREGEDPEYDWYSDRDGDGVVCE